ncbi:MAG: histidinol-phosphate transaminase [Melioribacteraceae bacterium]|nr:histidinol-phosphate transaminase [Melioribacteraceae bacterium]
MIERLVRKNILKLKPYTSARDSYLDGILMDANENSLGSVITDKSYLELNRYPDPKQTELRIELSKYLGISSSKLFFGVGSDEIIDLLIRIFCEPGKDSVLIPQPTYGMFKVACDVNNVNVIEVPLNRNFQLTPDVILSSVKSNTKMMFLCSPNNPTGNSLKRNSVLKIIKNFKGIIVVDEAYIDFCGHKSFIKETENFKNLVIIRTFSKAWGLAGVRCGYSIADEYVTDLLFKVKAPYNINKLSAESVLKALNNKEEKEKFVKKLNVEKNKLIDSLKKISSVDRIIDSDANFITFRINNARVIFHGLAKEGIIIRDRSNQLNMKNCLRVSVGTPKQNKLFIKKLKEML